jgi:catechol 2,3-dioxygenase-like lactoylglutathione lyase family enzyme
MGADMGVKQLMDMCSGIQHIGIPSGDVEETCCFYEGLGFKRVFQTVIRDTQRVVFLQSGNLILEAYQAEPVNAAGAIDHIAVDCPDVEAAYRLVLEKGYPVVSNGIEELPFWENGVRFFVLEGPGKEKIEFGQRL